jgi:hypothetical protein
MARLLAFDALFFLLPFAAYAAWLAVSRGTFGNLEDWQVKTIAYLSIAGAVLLLAVVVAVTSFTSAPPDGTYVPAHVENGQLIPGRIVPPSEAPPGGG